jgi:preprotein translocase subunit SecA
MSVFNMIRIRPDASMFADAGAFVAGRPYAERSEPEPRLHDRAAEFLLANAVRPVRDRLRDPARNLRSILEHVECHAHSLRAAQDSELSALARGLRARLRRNGLALELVGECFALVREAASRTIGQRHYEPQLLAGWALLQGKLVEMETGEGKTIAATLPAAVAALAGYPVHVITVNDYLAGRDADEMGPLYRFLGLSVGKVVQGMPSTRNHKSEKRDLRDF